MENNDITVILNCYRRPQYLRPQILAILEQSVKPKEIWIWVNESEETKSFDWFIINDLVEKHNIRVVSSNYNWKYCGRFSLACMVDTTWTAIFDDDTIPGTNWFANCLECMDNVHSDPHENVPYPILGGVGVTLHQDDAYQPNTRHGWVSANEFRQKVDLVGHAWFFPGRYRLLLLLSHKQDAERQRHPRQLSAPAPPRPQPVDGQLRVTHLPATGNGSSTAKARCA